MHEGGDIQSVKYINIYMRKIIKRMFTIVSILVLLFVAVLAFGYFYGSRHFVVHEQTFYFDDLPPAFDGYRIAQFSDFHAMAFHLGHDADVAKVVRLINDQHCDMIAFTGDIVTMKADELTGFEETLSQLSAPDGVYAIMGNHDYAMYMRNYTVAQRMADIKDLHRRHAAMGWKLLLNDHDVIRRSGDSLVVVGVENDGTPPHFPQFGDLDKATEGVADDAFKVLLSHDPTHWRRSVIPDTNIQLTLSGHTHAGQFKIFGWSPVSLVYDEWSGAYHNTRTDSVNGTTIKQTLHINEGIGCVPVPMRVGAWPEVTVITLRRN